MSTQATGDGKPDAVGAVKASAEASAAEPSITAVAEPAAADRTGWATEEPTAWDEDPEASEAGESAEATGPGEGGGSAESDALEQESEPGQGEEPGQGSGQDESGEAGEEEESESDEAETYEEAAEDYEEYDEDDDDVPAGGDEALEYDEDDGEYEDYAGDEAAGFRRARRWPRVLLALGFLALAGVIVGGAIAIVGSFTHGFKKPVKVIYKTSAVFSLKTGDCFDPVGQQSYTLVLCDESHQAEVFGTFALTGAKWPGATAAQAQASAGCASRFTSYVNPQLAISLASTYVYPDSVAWQAGTRTVVCEARATSGELTGSVTGSSASAG